MNIENTPLTGPPVDSSFYTGQEVSTGDVGTTGVSRRVLHGLTIISVLIASGCTIYGSVQAESAVFMLPLLVVLIWLCMHYALLYFAQHEQHDFHPPGWFIFISSGHILIQSLVVIILTLFKKGT